MTVPESPRARTEGTLCPSDPSCPPQKVLLVAVCGGQRCAALRRLRTGAPEVCGQPLLAAVRSRAGAVLLTTDCLQLWHRGGVAAVGWAEARGGQLNWLGSPVLVERVDAVHRAAGLAGWVQTTAPHPKTRPSGLR